MAASIGRGFSYLISALWIPRSLSRSINSFQVEFESTDLPAAVMTVGSDRLRKAHPRRFRVPRIDDVHLGNDDIEEHVMI